MHVSPFAWQITYPSPVWHPHPCLDQLVNMAQLAKGPSCSAVAHDGVAVRVDSRFACPTRQSFKGQAPVVGMENARHCRERELDTSNLLDQFVVSKDIGIRCGIPGHGGC